jgi:hypothetical protein
MSEVSEGRLLLYFTYYIFYRVLCLLDAARNKGRFNNNINESIILQFNLDILMSSPPHTPPRKGGRDKGRFNNNMNESIILQFKLDILMSSPHTPPRKGGPQKQSGCWYFDIYCFYLFIYEMDLDVDLDFRGASRMTGKKLISILTQSNQLIGGIIRGKATGNIFNVADMPPIKESRHRLPSGMGKVKLYISSANPELLDITKMHPTMTAEAPISDTIQPVLEALADNFSPVQGMCFYQDLDIYLLFLDKKQRIYVHDNGYWMVKGRFEKALAKDSKIAWDMDDSLSVLMVMWMIFCYD